jgi:hypothetical protein
VRISSRVSNALSSDAKNIYFNIVLYLVVTPVKIIHYCISPEILSTPGTVLKLG